MKTVIADGLSLNLPIGWDLESLVGTDGTCREINFRKGNLIGSLELISVGDMEVSDAQREYGASYEESLKSAGCRILENRPIPGAFVIEHTERVGQILHYVAVSAPIVHFSVAGISSAIEMQEVVELAQSIHVDSTVENHTREAFGVILPIALADSNWS